MHGPPGPCLMYPGMQTHPNGRQMSGQISGSGFSHVGGHGVGQVTLTSYGPQSKNVIYI